MDIGGHKKSWKLMVEHVNFRLRSMKSVWFPSISNCQWSQREISSPKVTTNIVMGCNGKWGNPGDCGSTRAYYFREPSRVSKACTLRWSLNIQGNLFLSCFSDSSCDSKFEEAPCFGDIITIPRLAPWVNFCHCSVSYPLVNNPAQWTCEFMAMV